MITKHSPSFWRKVGNLISVFGDFLNINTSNGNVGIGTTTPELPLDVNGNVRIGLSNGTTLEGNADWSSGDFSIKPFDNISASQFGWTYYGSGTRAGDIVTTGYGYAPNPNRVFAFRDGAVGVDRMVINVLTGNVGIGTTNPIKTLHVLGNSSSVRTSITSENTNNSGISEFRIIEGANQAAFMAIGASTTVSYLPSNSVGFVSSASGGFHISNETGFIRFLTNGTTDSAERMRINSVGNVGIGTTNPVTKLQVAGDYTTIDGLGFITSFTPTGGYARFGWWNPASPDTKFAFGSGYADASRMGFLIKTSGDFSASSEKMTILSNGNVGIGTTAPNAKLSVIESGVTPETGIISSPYTGRMIEVQGNGGAYFRGRDVTNDIEFIMGISTGGYSYSGSVSNHPFVIRTNNTDKMTILGNGNVGIGTTTPTAKLHVNGDTIRLDTAKTPSSASDTGNQGDIAWDSNYIYICTATNTWKRAALASW